MTKRHIEIQEEFIVDNKIVINDYDVIIDKKIKKYEIAYCEFIFKSKLNEYRIKSPFSRRDSKRSCDIELIKLNLKNKKIIECEVIKLFNVGQIIK